jgi:hypothetical protein
MRNINYHFRLLNPIVWCPGGVVEREGGFGDIQLRKNRKESKIVLPCRLEFPRKGRSFFQAHFAADLIFGPVIPWTPI